MYSVNSPVVQLHILSEQSSYTAARSWCVVETWYCVAFDESNSRACMADLGVTLKPNLYMQLSAPHAVMRHTCGAHDQLFACCFLAMLMLSAANVCSAVRSGVKMMLCA